MITENYEYNALLEYDKEKGVYNLFITTFNGNVVNANLNFFLCTRRHNARLDLVSADIYETTKWTGSLCQLNSMFHPHQVRDGDVITYLPESDLQGLLEVPDIVKQSGELISQVKSDLINALKKKKPDPKRKKFQDNRPNEDVLPPTVLPSNTSQIQVDNNKIKIAPDLFNNPNKSSGTPVDSPVGSATPQSPQLPPNNDQTERVLVRRYIKGVNE
jgi:hypothetical protein